MNLAFRLRHQRAEKGANFEGSTVTSISQFDCRSINFGPATQVYPCSDSGPF